MGVLTLLSGVTATNGKPENRAVGTITCVAKANLVDAETVTISDGTTSKVFEFDVAGDGVTGGRVQVNVSSDTTSTHVATRLTTAINAVSGFNVTATSSGAVVYLVNDSTGATGNVTITEGVADAGFSVTGMSGGITSVTGTLLSQFRYADQALLEVRATGSNTPSVTLRVWGKGPSGFWAPLGTGTASAKGLVNGGTALEATSNDILHMEMLDSLSTLTALYLEVTAISGTGTTVSAYLTPNRYPVAA